MNSSAFDREFPLDDLDIAQHRRLGVPGKPDDVTSAGDRAQHRGITANIRRYSVILFCCFLAPRRLSGLMFSRPINTRRTPASIRLLDEARNFVTQRIDLNGEADV